MTEVRTERREAVGIVTLDRPEKRNALSPALMEELATAVTAYDTDSDVRCIVITGSDEVFAAGADIKAMAEWGPDEVKPSVDALGDACDLLASIGTISIAAVNGFALGGGMEVALAADLRYLADDATIGQPEIRLGVIPGAGGTQRLTRLVGPGRARELVYTGRQVTADEALALGLAERVVPADEVLEAAIADARTLANGPRHALAAAKAAIRAATETPGAVGVARERELFLGLFGTSDQREGMRAFLEKRDPSF
jgi:enoyl-CoA hydratase/carnithine racemase